MGEPADGDEFIPRAPGGEALAHGRRMTYREARNWLKRRDVLFGRWRGPTIEWVADQDRDAFTAGLRRAEGTDCSLDGDVVLYRLADRRPVIVIDY
jgi:hypothetical protein